MEGRRWPWGLWTSRLQGGALYCSTINDNLNSHPVFERSPSDFHRLIDENQPTTHASVCIASFFFLFILLLFPHTLPHTHKSMAPIPITIITGFLGSGKTTLILNLIPQLKASNPDYKLALLKNEFGDLAVDSQLASSNAISGVREMLNGCICCNLVGQLSEALKELQAQVTPDRIVIETSGSAFPATLALEINRIARRTGNYVLDGVVSVIDVENWQGYEDTSVTARLQARYTDLIVFNKYVEIPARTHAPTHHELLLIKRRHL